MKRKRDAWEAPEERPSSLRPYCDTCGRPVAHLHPDETDLPLCEAPGEAECVARAARIQAMADHFRRQGTFG